MCCTYRVHVLLCVIIPNVLVLPNCLTGELPLARNFFSWLFLISFAVFFFTHHSVLSDYFHSVLSNFVQCTFSLSSPFSLRIFKKYFPGAFPMYFTLFWQFLASFTAYIFLSVYFSTANFFKGVLSNQFHSAFSYYCQSVFFFLIIFIIFTVLFVTTFRVYFPLCAQCTYLRFSQSIF